MAWGLDGGGGGGPHLQCSVSDTRQSFENGISSGRLLTNQGSPPEGLFNLVLRQIELEGAGVQGGVRSLPVVLTAVDLQSVTGALTK